MAGGKERKFVRTAISSHAFEGLADKPYAGVTSVDDPQWADLGEEGQFEMINDHVIAALDYLENSGNSYLAELAHTMTVAIAGGAVLFIPAEDTHQGLDEINAVAAETLKSEVSPDFPLFTPGKFGGDSIIPCLIVPFGFVQQARKTPVDAVATLAYRLSQVRDYMNGHSPAHPDSIERSIATVAEFHNLVLGEDRRIRFGEEALQFHKKYRYGIASLPEGVAYNGRFPHPRPR